MMNIEPEIRKKLLIAASSAVVLSGIIYLYFIIPDRQLFDQTRVEKIAEFSNLHVTGWEKGKKVWDIYAKKADSNRNQEIVNFEGIDRGTVYKNGKTIVKGLKAGSLRVVTFDNKIEAYGKSTLEPCSAFIDMQGTVSGEAGSLKGFYFTFITSPHLIYDSNTKKTVADNIIFRDKKYTAKAGLAEVDHNKEVSVLKDGPVIVAGFRRITAATIESYYRDETVKATGSAALDIKEKKELPTLIKADELFYSIKDEAGSGQGHVMLSQKGKTSFSKALDYDGRSRSAMLSGDVKTFFKKGAVILKEDAAARIKNAEAKKMLGSGVLLKCRALTVWTDNGNAAAQGAVEVRQKTSYAKADSAFYDDSSETITLTGNVRVEKDGQWLKTNKVIVSVRKESFEAIGDVETIFKLKR